MNTIRENINDAFGLKARLTSVVGQGLWNLSQGNALGCRTDNKISFRTNTNINRKINDV